jgi:hypothetical protein
VSPTGQKIYKNRTILLIELLEYSHSKCSFFNQCPRLPLIYVLINKNLVADVEQKPTPSGSDYLDDRNASASDYEDGKKGFNYIVSGVMHGPMINRFPD